MSWNLILPEIAVGAAALAIILTDLVKPSRIWPTFIGLSGITAGIVLTIVSGPSSPTPAFGGLLTIDGWTQFIRIVVLAAAAGVLLISTDYYRRLKSSWAEFNALALLGLLGMMFMSSSADLISAFVSIEITAISFFVLVGLLKDSRSSEASIKMMLLGGIASAVLLYGMAFVFGSSAGTGLYAVSSAMSSVNQPLTGFLLGSLLLVAGFSFEIAAVPFHMWAPDAYQGAPTPVTMYLSAGSKIAGMAVFTRVFATAFTSQAAFSSQWGLVIAVLAAVTMTMGNLLALRQTNIKRLLAYSGIAHTGYILIGLATVGMSQAVSGQAQLLFYLAVFALAEIAVFTVVIAVTRHLESEEITDFSGLGRRSPALGLALGIGLVSLTGLPPTAGFMAKLFIFSSAVTEGLIWLVIVAVINTVISAYYYFRVIKIMWSSDDSSENLEVAPISRAVSLVTSAGLLVFGIAPYILIKLAENSLITLP